MIFLMVKYKVKYIRNTWIRTFRRQQHAENTTRDNEFPIQFFNYPYTVGKRQVIIQWLVSCFRKSGLTIRTTK